MQPPPSKPEANCLRWLPAASLLLTYALAVAVCHLGGGSSDGLSLLLVSIALPLLLVTPVLAWLAMRRQQARLLNIAVLVVALFNLLSMFLA